MCEKFTVKVTQERGNIYEQIKRFSDRGGVFCLATADGNQPKVRPLGAHFEMDGKVLFGIGDFKDVYKQLIKNPLTEIVATRHT